MKLSAHGNRTRQREFYERLRCPGPATVSHLPAPQLKTNPSLLRRPHSRPASQRYNYKAWFPENGLLTLARWMIALADEDSNTDHQHFDNEVGLGFFQSDTDCELIIQRVGK